MLKGVGWGDVVQCQGCVIVFKGEISGGDGVDWEGGVI